MGGGLEGLAWAGYGVGVGFHGLASPCPLPQAGEGETQNLPQAGEGEVGKRDGRPKAPADVPQSEFRQNLYCAETANRLLELSKVPTSVLNVALVCSILLSSTQMWA